ncbi:hypothetical protein [Sinorhizobium prairiense]|uniref:hypothetical protein n=1 Tax=unclassified Sinorhizobium TaxID=2613772 RepID=UPI0023D8AAAA|nr:MULTISPECIES: hypothetical protein [unclassified Sinorhizobium]WEJ11173.1 hypothetical protein N0Q90_08750 [Sinorhizobium sp. M103]WEJ14227.1 hypothetical protein N0Q91_11570 [Sinorhizobium sp. K101]WEJ38157.1 hypothetical protein N0R80_08720 [Sinorhizobium sp. C101]
MSDFALDLTRDVDSYASATRNIFGIIDMKTANYIENDRYAFEAANLTATLRLIHDERIAIYPRSADPAEAYERVHVALRAARLVELGAPRVVNGRVEPEHYGALVEALATLEPDAATGTMELDQVKFVLAEVGAIFPESTNSIHKAVEEVRAPMRQILKDIATLGAPRFRAADFATLGAGGFDKLARQHFEAFRAEADREAEAAFAAAPEHLKHCNPKP